VLVVNGGDWRSKSLASPLLFRTKFDGFYFANCVLAAVFFSLVFSILENNLKISLELFANSKIRLYICIVKQLNQNESNNHNTRQHGFFKPLQF
jgi:hypothetical protein